MKKEKTAEELLVAEIMMLIGTYQARVHSQLCKRAWAQRKVKKARGSNKVK